MTAPATDPALGSPYLGLVAARFRASRLARAAWWIALSFFWMAGLAPFLAHRSPLYYSDEQGPSSPVLVELTAADLFWCGLLALGIAGRCVLAYFRRHPAMDFEARARRQRRTGILFAVLFLLLLAAVLARPARLYPERWRKWEELRRGGPAPHETVLWTPVGWDPDEMDLELLSAHPPSSAHWLGTDRAGRDLLSRLLYGARVSLVVGFVSMSIALAIGILVGALAGYFGGWVDLLFSRVIEVVLCFPHLFLILILLAYLPSGLITLMLLIGLLGWTGVARLTRAEFLRLKNQEFVLAARALGAGPWHIMWRHLLPNSMAPILVAATFGVAGAILVEASLSFLGFGVPPPTPTWGQMLHDGRSSLTEAPWLTFVPGVAVFLAVTSFNLMGEALRDALDPRMKPDYS